MIKFISNLFTERDNQTFCIARLMSSAVVLELMWKFATTVSVDYTNFGIAVSSLIAALAAKNYSEK